MSEVEAKKWQMRDIPKTGLYESFEEISEHYPEELKGAIDYLREEYEDEKEQMEEYGEIRIKDVAASYATTAAYTDFGDLYDKELIINFFKQEREGWLRNKRYDKRIILPGDLIDDVLVLGLPERYNAKEEAIPLSSALHLLHSLSPEVRETALGYETEIKQAIAREKGVNLNLMCCMTLREGKYFGIGMDFPEDLKNTIEEKLKPIRNDLEVRYFVTWSETHVGDIAKPGYDETEYAKIEIRATNDETLEMATRLLEGIADWDL